MSGSSSAIRQAMQAIVMLAMIAASGVGSAQTAPALGTTESFAVLAGSAVSNTGASVVTGDVGIWPNGASSITGFPPGSVTGTVHAGNAVALQAQSDLTAAYNSVAGQACDTVLTDTDLGGLTLNPGVYCFASSAQLTGTLTLDALGDPDAVFIFQIGTTLITATNSRVQVINGGSGCNVFWQVGSSATLGTATQFEGNILALTSITLVTGSSVSGRLLARNGAVTLDTNAVGGCGAGVCPIIELNPVTLPQGTLGSPYSATVTASNGTPPYVYTISSGSLPTGLVINSGTGEISGTPSTLGNFSFTIRAVDSEGCERSRSYTIIIAAAMCPAITLAPLTLPPANVGQAYSQLIVASGGTPAYVYSVTAGALPPGLALGPNSGELAGVLTIAGNFGFTVTATDSAGCVGSQPYTLLVNAAACPVISVLPTTLPVMLQGVPYSQTLTGNGGTSPYSFAVTGGALPPGLLLNPLTGVLSGTPTTSGPFSFRITVTDALGCLGSANYTAQVALISPPTTIPTLPPLSLLLLVLMFGLVGSVMLRRG